MIFRFSKKADLIEALEAKRKRATQIDAKNKAEHTKLEAEYEKAFREACRAALKWDYRQMKEKHFEINVRVRGQRHTYSGPSCPESLVAKIDRAIGFVKASKQERYAIQTTGYNRDLFRLLALDVPEAKGLC